MDTIIIGLLGIAVGIYFIKLSKKISLFQLKEAKRYFKNFNEIDNEWSSHGKVYTNGISLLVDKKTGKKKFIKQAEVCDMGILS